MKAYNSPNLELEPGWRRPEDVTILRPSGLHSMTHLRDIPTYPDMYITAGSNIAPSIWFLLSYGPTAAGRRNIASAHHEFNQDEYISFSTPCTSEPPRNSAAYVILRAVCVVWRVPLCGSHCQKRAVTEEK